MPKQKSPTPKKSEQFIVFVCQLPLSSHSKSHSIPTSPGLAGLCMQEALMSFSETSWVSTMGFAQISPLLLPSSHEQRVFSCAIDVFPATEETAQGRASLELKGSPFPTKYIFYIDIFVQRLNLACMEFN